MINILKNKWIKKVAFVFLGSVAGYAYYYFIGCTGNSCPITGSPYISTAYGMMIGFVLSLDSTKKKPEKGN